MIVAFQCIIMTNWLSLIPVIKVQIGFQNYFYWLCLILILEDPFDDEFEVFNGDHDIFEWSESSDSGVDCSVCSECDCSDTEPDSDDDLPPYGVLF